MMTNTSSAPSAAASIPTHLPLCEQYQVAGTNQRIKVRAETRLEHDQSPAIVYSQNGDLFVLPADLFFDGRFDRGSDALPPATESHYADRPCYRHRKSGGIYRLLCGAVMATDYRRVIVYAGESGCWTRSSDEFWDGRFERVMPDDQPSRSHRDGQRDSGTTVASATMGGYASAREQILIDALFAIRDAVDADADQLRAMAREALRASPNRSSTGSPGKPVDQSPTPTSF